MRNTQIRFQAEVTRFCQRIAKAYRDPTVIVCGSTAHGEDMPWSDIDIVVIADFKQPFLKRLEELSKLNDTAAPLEVVGYNPEEFISMLDRLDAKAIDAVESGLPFLSGSILSKLKSRFKDLKEKGLTRTACTYLLSREDARARAQ